jgi:hypothetical protein
MAAPENHELGRLQRFKQLTCLRLGGDYTDVFDT